MKRMLFAAAALAALSIGANARDDRLPAKFVGDWCLAEHTADHLSFYRRGRCTNPDRVDDWLTISPGHFDANEMRCIVLVAHANTSWPGSHVGGNRGIETVLTSG